MLYKEITSVCCGIRIKQTYCVGKNAVYDCYGNDTPRQLPMFFNRVNFSMDFSIPYYHIVSNKP